MDKSTPSVFEIMRMHVEALYVHDEHDKIVSINDWQKNVAPRFFLGRTEKGNIWRFRKDLPDALCEEIHSLCETEKPGLSEHPIHESDYVQMLSSHAPVEKIWIGPAYWFSKTAPSGAQTVPISNHNSHLLEANLWEWIPDVSHQQPFVSMVRDGNAVAVCASVRITDTAHEAGVETSASYRKMGYGSNVVSAWAGAVERFKAFPLYSTSLDNIASRNLAFCLGLSIYGMDFHIT